MAAKKKAVSNSAMAKKPAGSVKKAMAKKPAAQPARPASLAQGGRFTEGYGPYTQVGNPGAGVSIRPTASDYIRPPLTMGSNKKKKK
jgi:hypothetical protein